jgi:hypothetical protein
MVKLGAKTGPYAIDVVVVKHRNALVTTIVNSPVFDEMIATMEDAYDYNIGYVPDGYVHRPDLISNIFYGNAKNWWLLMLINSIPDPNEKFDLSQRILIPKIQ